MRSSSPERWTDQVWRAALMLLATAVALQLAFRIIGQLLPALLALAGLVFVIRLVIGFRRGDGW
jgi:hypothetical protein